VSWPRVESVEIFCVQLPYREAFTIATGTSTASWNLVVKVVVEGGVEGWGEGSPSYTVLGETRGSVVASARRLAELLAAERELSPERLYELCSQSLSPSAAAAVEEAVLDAWARSAGVSVAKLLGGPYREAVETDVTIGIMEPEEQAKRALKFVEMGFRVLKLKLGLDPEKDVERVRAVRDAVGEGVRIRVDANQGWSVEQAVSVINRIARFDVEYVEQPVRWDDLQGLARVRRESPLPIAVDESVKKPADVFKVARAEAADIVNIKVMKSGGLLGALRVAHASEAAGLANMVGCMGEGRLGITGAVCFAASALNVKYVDLDSDVLLAEDYAEGGSAIEKGVRKVPEGPGLGVKVDASKLTKLAAVKRA
jgi:L-alanine-DL-glutamate epimerase-like enolase superfamily enzyme